MNIFDKALEKVGLVKASRMAEILGDQNRLGVSDLFGVSQPQNYGKYLKAYADELWVYACVFTIANTIAGLPWRIIYKIKDQKGNITKEDVDGKGVKQLFERPNQNDENSTWNNLIEFTVASMELTGNGYWLQDEMDSGGKPKSLQNLISSRIRIKAGEEELIKEYLYSRKDGKDPVPFTPKEISHFKYISPNDYYYGQSSFSPCRWSVDTMKEAAKTNLNIFKNGMRLDGVLMTDQALGDKIYKRLADQFSQQYSGVSKAHKTPILEKGLKYSTIVGSMKDLEFILGMKMSREEVCAAFGVPPILVHILDKATYANYKESNIIYYENTIIPKLRKIEPVVNEIVRKYDSKAFFEFDLTQIEALKKDEKVRSETAKTYFSIGIPLNQIISKLNLPFEAVDGGDVGYLPLNLMQIGTSPEERAEGKTLKLADKSDEDDRKDILWKRFDALIHKIRKTYMKMIDKFFSGQERDILSRMGKSKAVIDIEAVLFNEKGETVKWAKESRKIHTVAIEENGKRELLNIGVDTVFNVSNPRVVRWLDRYGLEKAKEVIGKTREAVKDTLIEGIKEGEGIPKLKKRIADIYEPYKDAGYKATRIARTEVIGASNQGALEAYEQSEVVEKKGWLSSRIPDSREDHLKAEIRYSKGIPLNEDFYVGSGSGPAPGQMGVAEEDINCGCSIIPLIKK